MTNAEKMTFIRLVAEAIFASKAANTDMLARVIQHPSIVGGKTKGRWFKNAETGEQTIRGFDIDLNIDGRTLQLRFMEQNPDKTDGRGNLKWTAVLARQGHKMMWVINRAPGGGFLGRMQDGEWIPSKERAYTTVNDQAALDRPMENIPIIPTDVGIPDYVIQSHVNMRNE